MFQRFDLFAFWFASPWMLLWVAVAAAPLLIHLLNRRQYLEVPWAAMRYLLAAVQKQSRRMRIENLLLLIIRTLLVLFFVAALADFYWKQISPPALQGEKIHRVIVLDGSFSMGYRPGNQSRFEMAKKKAIQLIQQTGQVGDSYSLVLMSSPPKVLVGTASMNHQQVAQIIREMKLPHTTGDLMATLSEVKSILTNATKQSNNIKQEVYLFSDLGQNSWAPNPGVQANIDGQITKLAQQAKVHLIDLGQSAVQNTAIVDAQSDDSFVIVGRPVSFQVTIQHFGLNIPTTPQQVGLYIEGRSVQQKKITLGDSGREIVHFNYRFETPGDYKIEFRLTAAKNDLEIDNHRWLSLKVKESIRILSVAGRPGENHYLKVAFATPKYSKPLVQAEFVTQNVLAEIDLMQYDCLFLNNIGQFDDQETEQIRKFTQSGKGVVFFLGDQVQPGNYNRLFSMAHDNTPPLLPVEIIGPSKFRKQAYLFNPLDYNHQLIKSWSKHPQAGLFIPQVYKYVRMKLDPTSSAQVVLGYQETNDPAMIEYDLHHQTQGRQKYQQIYRHQYHSRVILFSFPASTISQDQSQRSAWTSFPILPSFVPLVQETWRRAIAPQISQRNLKVGDRLSGRLTTTESQPHRSIIMPNTIQQPASITTDSTQSYWTFDNTWQSGIYTLKSRWQPHQPSRYFALNVAGEESDLTKIDPAQLPAVLRSLQKLPTNSYSQTTELHSSSKNVHWLLYAVLGLLICETLLAWYFGVKAN